MLIISGFRIEKGANNKQGCTKDKYNKISKTPQKTITSGDANPKYSQSHVPPAKLQRN